MKILKPPWVNHNGKPIYSIDVHPDGSRFATAGQGESSGRITIWNVLPLIDAKKELNKDIPKMLCQMDNHFACVNCVRWSHNGTYLASAGDDKLIMIWRYAGGMSKTFGSDQANVETWRCIHTLRGHSGDVLDLSWSLQDKYLATCSIDNTIVIWNALKFPEQIKVLTGHSSMVKGVTWDPIGKYLASQSDDRSIIIWRTRDWQQEKTITKPFEESGGTTHVLRLAWSPDGSYMVSAHAMNNMGPTAQIISRTGWSTDMDFVGHRKAVTCVRFNPLLLSRKVKKGSKERSVNYCCCAVGSRDSSCSIWLTALRRPLVVLHDLFENSILDMAWNNKGTQLFVCSSDGSVAFVQFSNEEIGRPLADEEKTKLLCKMYGNNIVLNGNKATQIIENADLLNIHQQNVSRIGNDGADAPQTGNTNSKLTNGFHPPNKEVITTSTQQSASNSSRQIETRTKDGRRRITPIFLSPPPAVADLTPPQPVFTSTNQSSKIVIERTSNEESSADKVAMPTAAAPTESHKTSDEDIDMIASFKPMSSAEAVSLSPKKMKKTTASDTPKAKPTTNNTTVEKEVINKIPVKRKAPPPQANTKKKKDQQEPSQQPSPTVQTFQPPATPTQTAVTVTPLTKVSSLRLPIPELKKTFSYQRSGDGWSLSACITNNISLSSTASLHKIHCTVNNNNNWVTMFNTAVLDVQASRFIVCVTCQQQSLSIFDLTGLKVLPDIVKDSTISRLSVNDYNCMIVTQNGVLSHWDFKQMRCVVNDLDLSPLLNSSCTVEDIFLTINNLPCVKLSNGSVYIYNIDLCTWLCVSRYTDNVLNYASQDTNTCLKTSVTGPVASITSQLKVNPRGLTQLYKGDVALQQHCTSSVIHNQLALCKAMNSLSEYRAWLLVYVRFLTQNDDEASLRALCTQCTESVYKSKCRKKPAEQQADANESDNPKSPPNFSSSSKASSQVNIMNLNKVELLNDILPIVATNLRLQRLYTEFKDLLDVMQSAQGKN